MVFEKELVASSDKIAAEKDSNAATSAAPPTVDSKEAKRD